jgi:hypothetical protein
MPLQYDGEKLYFNIAKPTLEELETLPSFDISSRIPLPHLTRRQKSIKVPSDIPITEWRKRLAMIPEDLVRKTLENTTHYYLSPEMDNRQDPRNHLKSTLKAIRHRRRDEMDSTDTFFPSVNKTAQGHTCSKFFVSGTSNKWGVHPLRKESQNLQALQDHCRTNGIPAILRSDNAQSETGSKWTAFLRDLCIETQTTVPHNPQMNPAERNIGDLGSMVRICHKEFSIPFEHHHWTQKWCCDVHNIASSRKLNYLSPDAIQDGYLPDISPFRFYVWWEPIWHYDQNTKAPLSKWKKGRWMGFAHTSGDRMTYWIRTERGR